MGAKDWLLAYCEADPCAVLRDGPVLDRAAARAAAERLFPGRLLTGIADGNLGDNANPDDDVIYVGAYPGLTLACTSVAALDHPSRLPRSVLEALPAARVYLHAMHSAVDWFAYAVWIDGRLNRALSLSPDSGVMDDVGEAWPFEQPYWAGERPVDLEGSDPDDDEPYPFPFHPLELAETALQELLGFTYEGMPRPDDVDPEGVPLAGFKIT